MTVQVSVMSEGGSGTSVPDMSIEVDDIDESPDTDSKSEYPYRIRSEDGTLGSA